MHGLQKVILVLVFLQSLWTAVISQKQLDYRVAEEEPEGTVIGDLMKDGAFSEKFSQKVINTLEFAFLTENQIYLTIGKKTGILKTSTTIDRDTMCPKMVTCTISVDVTVRPQRYFEIIKVRIDIMDINDNGPVFPKSKIEVSVPESKDPGMISVISPATDKDAGLYGIQRYEIGSGNKNKFSLAKPDLETGADLQLVLKERLDREQQDFYKLKIIAIDGGVPSKSGETIVEIKVEDRNDNQPKFEKESYAASVQENTRSGTSIIQVKAHDADEGVNQIISYSFTSTTTAKYGKVFAINSATGDISLTHRLNYQDASAYILGVIARDRGENSVPVSVKVTITVVDVNNYRPEIKINHLGPSDNVEISEKEKPGFFVAYVSVKDKDGGKNGELECTIDNKIFDLKTMYKYEYKVVTAAELDRELCSSYVVTIRCKDHGDQPLHSSEHLRITVTDENDNDPVFAKQIYFVNIKENNKPGAFIVQVNATDRDIGRNSELVYEVEKKKQHLLQVNRYNGFLTAAKSFNRETLQDVETLIYAKDKGTPSRTATATVFLKIDDINDERPKFSQKKYTFSVSKLQGPGEIGHLFANDKDSKKYNKYKFYIEGGDTADLFRIGETSGKFFMKRHISKHNHSIYELVVVVRDSNDEKLFSKTNVSVYVKDTDVPAVSPTPIVTFLSGKTFIIIVALGGALGLVFIILVVVLIVYSRRRHRYRRSHGYMSGNLVRVIREMDRETKRDYDSIRKRPDLYVTGPEMGSDRSYVTLKDDRAGPIFPMTTPSPSDYQSIEFPVGRCVGAAASGASSSHHGHHGHHGQHHHHHQRHHPQNGSSGGSLERRGSLPNIVDDSHRSSGNSNSINRMSLSRSVDELEMAEQSRPPVTRLPGGNFTDVALYTDSTPTSDDAAVHPPVSLSRSRFHPRSMTPQASRSPMKGRTRRPHSRRRQRSKSQTRLMPPQRRLQHRDAPVGAPHPDKDDAAGPHTSDENAHKVALVHPQRNGRDSPRPGTATRERRRMQMDGPSQSGASPSGAQGQDTSSRNVSTGKRNLRAAMAAGPASSSSTMGSGQQTVQKVPGRPPFAQGEENPDDTVSSGSYVNDSDFFGQSGEEGRDITV